MKETIKNIVKVLLTAMRNPTLVICNRRIQFPHKVFIGRGTKVRGRKYLYIERNVRIGNNFEVSCYPEFGGTVFHPEVKIESNCYIGDRVKVLCNASVLIRRNALLASDILISTENHGTDVSSGVSYGHQTLTEKPVEIGENCWIGEKVIILPGVSIGKWSVVGAGAVVTKSIPDYCMAVGNPAKVIKRYNIDTHVWERI